MKLNKLLIFFIVATIFLSSKVYAEYSVDLDTQFNVKVNGNNDKGDSNAIAAARVGNNDYMSVVQVHRGNREGTNDSNIWFQLGEYHEKNEIKWHEESSKAWFYRLDNDPYDSNPSGNHLPTILGSNPHISLIDYKGQPLMALSLGLVRVGSVGNLPPSTHLLLGFLNYEDGTIDVVYQKNISGGGQLAVAMNEKKEIVLINQTNNKLSYYLGEIKDGDDNNLTVDWQVENENYDNGVADYLDVDMNDKGEIIEVHTAPGSNKNAYYRVGIIGYNESAVRNEIFWQESGGKKYTTGRRPYVTLDNDRRVVEGHRGKTVDDMWMTAGKLEMINGKLDFVGGSDNGGKDQNIGSKSGKSNGVVFLNDEGKFVLLRSNGGSSRQAWLYYRLGNWNN